MICWYAAYTKPQSEARAAQELRNQGLDVFLPLSQRLRQHARRVDMVLRPLFPRYLFVAMDTERNRWRSVNGTRGVVHLVQHADRPAVVPAGIVEGLRSRADPGGIVPLDALEILERGRLLRVTAGPFAGHTGRYETLTAGERVVLLLDLLGRSVEIALPRLHVDAA